MKENITEMYYTIQTRQKKPKGLGSKTPHFSHYFEINHTTLMLKSHNRKHPFQQLARKILS